ncbi:MAG: transposase [Pyrinomonadaceae bacterium]
MVQAALLKFHDERYRLDSWVIMPNHVHVLLRALADHPLDKILHSIKSFTALEANKMLGRRGRFWMREAFDRYIRSEAHYGHVIHYIENNPVKARLCGTPEEWEFSSAGYRWDRAE